jgi:hypothetical protein
MADDDLAALNALEKEAKEFDKVWRPCPCEGTATNSSFNSRMQRLIESERHFH